MSATRNKKAIEFFLKTFDIKQAISIKEDTWFFERGRIETEYSIFFFDTKEHYKSHDFHLAIKLAIASLDAKGIKRKV